MGLLRIVLAIAVLIAHSGSLFGLKLTGGTVAVEVFFIISGFYMTMILDRKYTGKGSYYLFLSNRFLRLYPIYWMVIFLTVFASIIGVFTSEKWGGLAPYVEYFDIMSIKTLLFHLVTNIILFGQDVVMFLGMHKDTGELFFTSNFQTTDPKLYVFLLAPQSWSLGIELMFYLVAPFIVRKSNMCILFLLSLSLLIRGVTYFYLGYNYDPWTYRFFPSELALFLLGTISYRIYKANNILEIDFMMLKLKYIVCVLFFSVLIFYQFIPESASNPQLKNWALYIFCCLSLPFIFTVSKSSKFDAQIGELSYPVYVSHVLVFSILFPLLTTPKWQEQKVIIAIISTMFVSYMLVVLIAKPIEKIRQSRVQAARKQLCN